MHKPVAAIADLKSTIYSFFEYLRNSPVGLRWAKGAFWSLIGTVISRALMLISTIVAARILGVVRYGEYGVILGTIGMLSTFAGFSLGQMATKYVAEFYQIDPEKAGRVISISSLFAWLSGGTMTIVLCLFADTIASRTLAAPHLAHQLRLASLLLLLGSLSGAQLGALYGFESFKIIARLNVITGVTSIVAIVSGTWLFGLDGAIWGSIISRLIAFLAGRIALQQTAANRGLPNLGLGKNCLKEIKLVWHFGLPAVMSGSMVGPIIWVTSAFIVNQSNGYAEMGIFNAANQYRQLIIFFPSTLAPVVLPMLSNFHGIKDSQGYQKIFWLNLIISTISAIIIALPIILFAPWFMARFGLAFKVGSSTLVLLCIAAILMAALDGIGPSIVSEGKMWFGLILNFIWGIVMLVASYILRKNGAIGLATATLIAYSVHLLTSSIYVKYRMSKWQLS